MVITTIESIDSSVDTAPILGARCGIAVHCCTQRVPAAGRTFRQRVARLGRQQAGHLLRDARHLRPHLAGHCSSRGTDGGVGDAERSGEDL